PTIPAEPPARPPRRPTPERRRRRPPRRRRRIRPRGRRYVRPVAARRGFRADRPFGRRPAGWATSMPNVWIAGAGMTRIGRRSEPLGELMADAAHAALAAAGRERPDFIIVATMNPEEFVGDGNFASNIATYMGFAETPALRVETATSSGAAALYAGVAQVAASLHRTVLVVGGEKMTHLPTPRVSEIIGRSIDPYERAYGATMPALAGLVTRALMARRGVGVREIAQVAVKNHANAARN